MCNYMSFPLDADRVDFEGFPEGPRVGTAGGACPGVHGTRVRRAHCQFVKDLFELGSERPVVEFIVAMEHVNETAATRNIKTWWSQQKTSV